jgi:hypothetical protein
MDTKAMIEKATGGLELVTEGILVHIKRTTLLDRVTHYLQEQFSGKADSEAFILNSMYSEFYKDYIIKPKKEGKEEGKDLLMRLLRLQRNSLKMIRQLSINLHTSLKVAKFEFKTQEGTYLHGKRLFRALNYANMIEYNGKKSKSLCIFG